MICYKDRAFCSESRGCANFDCDRRISEQDFIDAAKLDLPFSILQFKSDDCGYVSPIIEQLEGIVSGKENS